MTAVEQPGSDGVADPDLLRDFIDFYTTTVRRTFGTAYRAAGGDEHVAHEATQEAYAAMWKPWSGFRQTGDAHRYVAGIAVHKVADFYRLRKKECPLGEEHDCGYDEPGYGEVLDTMTVLSLIRDFLDHQPPRRRAVGVLFFLEEFGYSEIAKILGISDSTARTHVQRLREKLQPYIDRITRDEEGGERS